jgi:hypothetical protein
MPERPRTITQTPTVRIARYPVMKWHAMVNASAAAAAANRRPRVTARQVSPQATGSSHIAQSCE